MKFTNELLLQDTQRNNVIMIDLTKNDFTFEDIRQYL